VTLSWAAQRRAIGANLLARCRADPSAVTLLRAQRSFRLDAFIEQCVLPQATAYGYQAARLDLRPSPELGPVIDLMDARTRMTGAAGLRSLWILENATALALSDTKLWAPLIGVLAHHANPGRSGQPTFVQVLFVGAQWQVDPILSAWRARMASAPLRCVQIACAAEGLQ
jgi:hypothetical protein